jgi:guanylate kinase
MNKTGKLIIFSAPSGAGKTSIVKAILESNQNLGFSISATSRSTIREGEVNGEDYYFLSPEEFKRKIDNDEFVEWEEVYNGTHYGTLNNELERIWSLGKHVIFDIDVQGGLNLKKQFGDRALAIFVKPPSVKELENRLQQRGSESQESLNMRIEKAEHELSFAPLFDKTIVNDDLEQAILESQKHINQFLN